LCARTFTANTESASSMLTHSFAIANAGKFKWTAYSIAGGLQFRE
jgi:hypothetical protein